MKVWQANFKCNFLITHKILCMFILQVKDDWKYCALVADRLMLWIYMAVCFVGAVGILLNAPVLYDNRPGIVGAGHHGQWFTKPRSSNYLYAYHVHVHLRHSVWVPRSNKVYTFFLSWMVYDIWQQPASTVTILPRNTREKWISNFALNSHVIIILSL